MIIKLDHKERKMKILDEWLEGNIDSDSKNSWMRRIKIKVSEIENKMRDIKKEISKLSIVDKINGYVDLMKSVIKWSF